MSWVVLIFFRRVWTALAVGRSRPYNFGQVVELPNRKEDITTHHIIQEPMSPKWTTQNRLRGWIEKEYGVENTQILLAETLLKKSEKEQLKVC